MIKEDLPGTLKQQLKANNILFTALFTGVILLFFKRPTKQRVINELQINWQEQQEL